VGQITGRFDQDLGVSIGHFGYLGFLKDSVVIKLNKFLQEYQEGAFVMLALLDAAHHGWYGDVGLPEFPGIVGKHPIEVLRLIKKLNDIMRSNSNFEVILKYFDRARILNFFEKVIYRPDIYLKNSKADKDFLNELRESGGFDFAARELRMPDDKPKGVRFLKMTLTDRWDWFSKNYPDAARQWVNTDEIERWYSLNHAWEIVFIGGKIANTDTSLVCALVHLLKDTEARLVEAKQREIDEKVRIEDAKKREEIEKECAEKMANISIAPLENLDPVVLSESELKAVKDACRNELDRTDKRDWDVKAVLKVIDEFVEFCTLLPKPENLLKTRTGQLVTHRTVSDMEAEASLELVNLDPYTAEAKLIRDGKQGEVRIKTRKLDEPLWKGKELENLMSQIKDNMERLEYVRKRSDIEREIMQRQEKWRRQIPDSTRQIPPSEEPPPTYY
jgi:hypothetical protein